jgi:hypothetical protein
MSLNNNIYIQSRSWKCVLLKYRFHNFYDEKYTHGIVTGSRTTRVKVAVSGTPNCLQYRVVFMVYTQFINKAVGRIINLAGTHAPRGPRVGYPRLKVTAFALLTSPIRSKASLVQKFTFYIVFVLWCEFMLSRHRISVCVCLSV